MPTIEVKRLIFSHNDLLENADDKNLAHFFRTIIMASIRDLGHKPSSWVLISKDEFEKMTNGLGGIITDSVKSVEKVEKVE